MMPKVRCSPGALAWSVLLALPVQVFAQTGTIAGRVVEAGTARPIPGAGVMVEGTNIGTLTQTNGAFSIPGVAPGTYQVVASMIGYGSAQQQAVVQANATVRLEFELQTQAIALQEIVATGYTTQRRQAITGSVATVQAADANVGVISNANELIQGRVAGVQITLNNGEPGAGAQVRLRGGTSISASNEPLYVIDGVPIDNRATEARGLGIDSDPPLSRSPLTLLNPSDIESVTVLKDAAATAIYGSRAANGVVLIQTRRGGQGGATLEYDGYVAAATAASRLDLMTGSQYRSFVQSLVTAGDDRFTERLARLGNADTDWESALLRTGVTQNHNLAFSGGSQTTQYRASLNYMDQEGVVISSGFRRLQGRLNANHQALNDRLRLGLNLTASEIKNDYVPFENTGGFEGGLFTNMVIFDPTRPITISDPQTGTDTYYEEGTGRQEKRNPVALANQVDDFGTTTRTLGNVTAALDLFGGLTGQLNFGVDRSDGLRQGYLPKSSPVGAEFEGRARQVNTENTALTLQTFLTLRQRLAENHDLDLVGGYEYADYTAGEFGAEGRGFATDAFRFNNLGGGSVNVPPFSWREESRLVSFFSRLNYGFKDRYFLTGVLRRDGSSRFGAGNKWATFPALSGSWRISEEDFLRGGMFSELRLRAGYGVQGNQAVPPYASLITLAPGNNYSFGENPVVGITPNRNPNPNLKWEETSQFNVAIDYGLWDSRVVGSVEYYVKNTEDLLLDVPVPQPALVPTRLENIGKTRSRGIELSADALVMARSNMNWRAGLVFAADRNEVVDLGGRNFLQSARASGQGQSDTWTQRLIAGEPLGTFYGPEFVGVDSEGRQLFNQYRVERDASGAIIRREKIGETTSPTGDDYVVLGNGNPDFTFGLRNQVDVGRFDLSFFVRGEVGQEVFNNTALVYATKGAVLQGRNFIRSALDDGVGLEEPAIYSSRWIEDGSFLRVQNVTLGYRFDAFRFIPQVQNGRIYVSFDNLLLLTGYSGYDPEVHTAAEGLSVRGVDYLNYPRPRTITTGVRFTF